MKKSFLLLVVALFTLSTVAQADPPLKVAEDHLAKTKALLERPNVKNANRNQNALVTQLDLALTEIDGIKENKGSHLPLAKKAAEAAKAEIVAGNDEPHRTKALEQVNEALKQLEKAWNIRH